MVKVDLTRDYYGDLELQPGADIVDIKKQFKKLALTYHPDRNPGRESEVIPKFQNIQSAHEVLTDIHERAKYDANRNQRATRFGNSYAGASGVRGNPWSNVSAQYPTPPKPPTARRPAPSQPSAGAQRYKHFKTPEHSAYQAAQEGAGARKSTYEAWESMKTKPQSNQSTGPGPGKTWKSPRVPPRSTPQTGREESNARANVSPPKSKPNNQEFRNEGTGSYNRSHSTNASYRKGFMPNTPGGDEPAAPGGAYFTQRNKPTVAPDLPSREPPINKPPHLAARDVPVDPLRQFRENGGPHVSEPRLSTPYATHGGEKLNPFDDINLHRSKSTRETFHKHDSHVPRNGSSPNLASPHRSRSFAEHSSPGVTSNPYASPFVQNESSSSSEEKGPPVNRRAFGKARARGKESSGGAPVKNFASNLDSSARPQHTGKPSKISHFRQWYKDNPDQDPTLNGVPPDEYSAPSSRGDASTNTKGEPSMYAKFISTNPDTKRTINQVSKLPTVLEVMSSSRSFTSHADQVDLETPDLSSKSSLSVSPPSGFLENSVPLTAFEGFQRNLVDDLIKKRRSSNSSVTGSAGKVDSHEKNERHLRGRMLPTLPESFATYRESTETESPPKKFRAQIIHANHISGSPRACSLWSNKEYIRKSTNKHLRFNLNVNDETFKSTSPFRANGFSNSAENISTNFSAKDWDGKFAAGGDYFKPEQKGAGTFRTRAQSASRSRGRSPVKLQPTDPHYVQHSNSANEPVIESPGGTKFSAQEWADTFKPQTFAPPPTPTAARPVPTRKRTGPSRRQTLGGKAAVIDDGDMSDEKPLFTGPRPSPSPHIPSPDEMDVDTPPASITVPQFKSGFNAASNTTTHKPPEARPQSPIDQEALKVNFADLKIQDLLNTIAMPTPPLPPVLPVLENAAPSKPAFENYKAVFTKYMAAWDLYDTQFMLHLVARKRQNDGLGEKRFNNEQGIEIYRRGLREDTIVLERWAHEKMKHEQAVKEWIVRREKMKDAESIETRRQRKKTH